MSHSSYDPIAGMYHALWYDWYLPAAMPALTTLFFDRVARRAKVLDVCCGSGHVTKELVRRGYNVTGVDISAELIQVAQQQLPGVEFVVQDVRSMELADKFEAALSTFDALNHILNLADLNKAFQNVHNALQRGAPFVFDMNLHEAYTQDLKQWTVDINDNSVGLVRGEYDRQEMRARTELIWFSRSTREPECWRQRASIVVEQCYPREQIVDGLKAAGFHSIATTMAPDLGVAPELACGRMYVTAIA